MHLTLRHPNWVLLGALILGICADYFFYNRLLGISVPLFIGLSLALLLNVSRVEGRRVEPSNLWLGGLALCFGIGVMLRATPLLVTLDLLAVLGIHLLMLGHYQDAPIMRLPMARVIAGWLDALAKTIVEPVPLIAQSVRSLPATPTHRLIPIGRGLLLALPVVVCFGGLLMSADSVFASYVREATELPFAWTSDLLTWSGHLLFTLIATYLCSGMLMAALARQPWTPGRHLTPADQIGELPAEGDTQRLDKTGRRFLGFTEALTVLVAVDLLFGSFMLIQATYFFGGNSTLERTGMTYADYARRGFFELLIVTCLALALVWTLAYCTQRVQRWKQHAFNGTSAALIVMMLGMLASAFQRLMLYEEAYGFTRLRIYTHSFMIWLAIILLIFGIALYLNRFRVFVLGCIVTGIAYLGLLNTVNTDALIVRNNIARYQQSGKLDAPYLSTLSFDATPALVSSLDAVRGNAHTYLNTHLINQYHTLLRIEQTHGWPSWHVSRSQALRSLRQRYGQQPPASHLPDLQMGSDGSASVEFHDQSRTAGLLTEINIISLVIASGSIPVHAPTGTMIQNLTLGQWYAIETTDGPWKESARSVSGSQYGVEVSDDHGRTWVRLSSMPGEWYTFTNSWGAAIEPSNENYIRACWLATTSSIRIRVADSRFDDNSGSLSWRLYKADPC